MAFDKKYLRRVATYVMLTIIAIGVSAYIGYHLWQSTVREIETSPALLEDFSVTVPYEVIIFRDEVALTSDLTGEAVPSVRDGEKVGKSVPVATVFNVTDRTALSRLESVRRRIRLLEGGHITTLGSDLGIGETMNDFRHDVKNGSISSAAIYSDKLSALILARAQGSGSIADLVKELETKEASILATLGNETGKVYTPCSGWYYSHSDGYESILTPSDLDGITPDALEALLSTSPKSTDGTAGRLVRTHKWYVAVIMTHAHGAVFTEGTTTEVTVPGVTEPVTFTVESSVRGTESTAVVFSCEVIPDGVDIGRRLTLEFCVRNITGFAVPKEALRSDEGITGVFTYNGVMVKFRRVDIAVEMGDFYIVTVPDDKVDVPTEPPATEDGTDTAVPDDVPDFEVGTGRKDYYYLSPFEQIIVKGKNLYNGKIVG